ncbi:MAG: hypothetical protein K0Q95_791 [Bacteroidota bacterium]|jgi:hypothetical protein|nr:hypothetical protein [Bacteroidota bacterium]
MKTSSLKHILILSAFLLGLASCVTKKKYSEFQKIASIRDSLSGSQQAKLSARNDSLQLVIAEKDSIIDSLRIRLNETSLKKEKGKSSGYARKSTLTKTQEYEKKSLFIYNFTKYIEWPIEYNGIEFVIGVAGDDAAVKQLRAFMLEKKVSGKKIIVEKYKKGNRYNLVYVTSSQNYNFSSIKSTVKNNKTLLVTDESVTGTHISFLLDDDKVRYNVDKSSIERSGLKVGQELMRFSG